MKSLFTLCLLFSGLLTGCLHAGSREKYTLSTEYVRRPIVENGIQIELYDFEYDSVSIDVNLAGQLPRTIVLKDSEADVSIRQPSASGKNSFSVPEGEYFGRIIIDAVKTRPPFYSEFAMVKINFGYESTGGHTHKTSRSSCISEGAGILGIHRIQCPKLVIAKHNPVRLILRLQKDQTNWLQGTTWIWTTSIGVCILTVSPAGILVPLIHGPVGKTRSIQLESPASVWRRPGERQSDR